MLIASWLAWGLYASFSYDAQGNTTAKGAQGYYFDLGKRLLLVSGVASYSYDGLGRRVYAVSIPQATYRTSVYSQGGQLLYTNVQQGTSNTSTRYIYLAGKLIAEDGTAGVVYTHTDALGSPVARSSSTGTLLSNTWYEPYGKTAQGTNPQTIGFTAHVNDADTGLIYMQQRYYEPVSGRFLSTDQVGTNPNTGSSFNRYAYAQNNPYRYVDPDGRFAFLIPVGVAAANFVADAVLAYGGRALFVASAAAVAKWAANATKNESTEAPQESGSYTNTHESGKTYHGKGDKQRSQQSGQRVEQETGDIHVATDWTAAPNSREGFKQESERLDSDGGPKSEENHNKIESPGKKYREQDGRKPPEPPKPQEQPKTN